MNAVTRLVDLGVLREITGRNYNRVFSAPAVFDILVHGGVSRTRTSRPGS